MCNKEKNQEKMPAIKRLVPVKLLVPVELLVRVELLVPAELLVLVELLVPAELLVLPELLVPVKRIELIEEEEFESKGSSHELDDIPTGDCHHLWAYYYGFAVKLGRSFEKNMWNIKTNVLKNLLILQFHHQSLVLLLLLFQQLVALRLKRRHPTHPSRWGQLLVNETSLKYRDTKAVRFEDEELKNLNPCSINREKLKKILGRPR